MVRAWWRGVGPAWVERVHAAARPAGRALLGGAWLALSACGLAAADNFSGQSAVVTPGSDTTPKPGSSGGTQPVVVDDPNAVRLSGTFGAAAVASTGDDGQATSRAWTVRCLSHAAKLQLGQGALTADGNFAVAVPGGKNNLVGCSLLDEGNAVLGHFTFQGHGLDLEGNALAVHAVALTGDVDLGRVYYDETTFEVAVNADSLVGVRAATAAAGDAVSLTGAWQVHAVDFDLPAGLIGPCAASEANCATGLREGDTLQALQLAGRRKGTQAAAWALQLWDKPTQMVACGNRLGVNAATQAAAAVDFSAIAPSNDVLTYSTGLNYTAPDGSAVHASAIQDGWRLSAATAQVAYPMCKPVAETLGGDDVQLTVCGPDSSGTWRAAYAEGCVDADTGRSSSAVPSASDWAAVVGTDACTTRTPATGLKTYTCTLPVAATGARVRCTATQGDFSDAGRNVPKNDESPTNTSVGLSALYAAVGDACADIGKNFSTAATQLAQARCYADFVAATQPYAQNAACIPQVEVVPDASDAADAGLLQQNFRPLHLRHADLLQALDGGRGGTVTTRRHEVHTAWAPSPGFGVVPISCATVTTRSMDLVVVSETRLLAVYTEHTGTDDLRPACLAAFARGATQAVAYLDRP